MSYQALVRNICYRSGKNENETGYFVSVRSFENQNFINLDSYSGPIDDDMFMSFLLKFLSHNNYSALHVFGNIWLKEDTKSKLRLEFFLDITVDPNHPDWEQLDPEPRIVVTIKNGSKVGSVTLSSEVLYAFVARYQIAEKIESWIVDYWDYLATSIDEKNLIINYIETEIQFLNQNKPTG